MNKILDKLAIGILYSILVLMSVSIIGVIIWMMSSIECPIFVKIFMGTWLAFAWAIYQLSRSDKI